MIRFEISNATLFNHDFARLLLKYFRIHKFCVFPCPEIRLIKTNWCPSLLREKLEITSCIAHTPFMNTLSLFAKVQIEAFY